MLYSSTLEYMSYASSYKDLSKNPNHFLLFQNKQAPFFHNEC